MTHYHASALGGGMPMARGAFRSEAQARHFLLSFFSRLPEHSRQRLSRRPRRRRYATWSATYVLLVEECDASTCHLNGNGH